MITCETKTNSRKMFLKIPLKKNNADSYLLLADLSFTQW